MRVLLAVAVLVSLAGAASVSLEDMEFHSWKMKFGKGYSSDEEESQRKMIWLTNRKLVLEHNMLADQGLKNYRLGMNHFADMNNQEFQAKFANCLRTSNQTKTKTVPTFPRPAERATVPEEVDWRDLGYVTDIKNQKHCGSCWAFSSVGALEGQMFRKTGKLIPLSEQQLVDCSWLYGNYGCKGGYVERTFSYVIHEGGLEAESTYPYEGKEGMCRFKQNEAVATSSTYGQLPAGNEEELMYAVSVIGPISVSIDASRHTFQFYASGVYDDPYCSKHYVTHAVLVVGYGYDTEKGDYWLVKNSWSTDWGEKGFIKMSRNKNNQCGIASYAIYPVI